LTVSTACLTHIGFSFAQLAFGRFARLLETNPEEWDAIKRGYEQELDGEDDSSSSCSSDSDFDGAHERLERDAPGFPPSVSGDKILFQMQDLFSPDDSPQIQVEGDIDSVHRVFHSLEDTVAAIGERMWHIPSVTTPLSADTGSRFKVNSENCNIPAFVRGEASSTVPLNWFPNIRLATVPIAEWGCEFHIQLYFLGSEKLVTNHPFPQLWMGVVNAMFNLARTSLVIPTPNEEAGTEGPLSSIAKELMRCQPLETPVGNKGWRANKSGVDNRLSAKAMKQLAPTMITVLRLIASNNIHLKFEDPAVNGIQFEDSYETSLDRTEMVAFAKKLMNNIAFTATIAGCKQHFCQPKCCKKLDPLPASKHIKMMKQMSKDELKVICTRINERHGTHFDCEEFDPDVHDECEDLPSLQECGNKYFPTIVGVWLDDINVAIKNAMDEVHHDCVASFHQTFKPNEPASEAEAPSSMWHIDIGTEFRIVGVDMNLFTQAANSKELLKRQLKQDRSVRLPFCFGDKVATSSQNIVFCFCCFAFASQVNSH